MKNMKRLIPLILAVLMLAALFAGCGTAAESKSSVSSVSAAPATDAPDASAAEPVAEPTAEPAYFPLAETTDVSLFCLIGDISAYIDDYNDTWFYQELEARTNVHVNFTTATSSEAANSMNIMFAGGDVTNLVENLNNYYGLNAAYVNELILDLTDSVAQYMPNYQAVVASNDSYAKGVKNDEGLMLQICQLDEDGEAPALGLIIRSDLLADIGLTSADLVTYDDYYNAFTAMKTECGVAGPMWISNFGSTVTDAISAGYGISTATFGMQFQPFFQVDGDVKFGPMEDSYAEWLTMMNKWYAEGLIYADYMSAPVFFMPDTNLVTTGTIACWVNRAGVMNSFTSDDADFALCAAANPVLKEGDVAHLRASTEMVDGEGWAVSSDVDDALLEVLCKWMDYFYSDEGYTLFNWGLEDTTYTAGADGQNVYTDLIMANADFNNNSAIARYNYLKISGPFLRDTHTFDSANPANEVEAGSVWRTADDEYMISGNISMTTEESDEFSGMYGDIATQVTEWTNKVIVGDADISSFDDFRALLTEMGIEDCIALKQAAVDRYNQR